MRNPEIELLEADLDDGLVAPEPLELGFSIDLVSDDLDDADDLGLYSLYENPEALLKRPGARNDDRPEWWPPRAA
jgi:hypothetical protein